MGRWTTELEQLKHLSIKIHIKASNVTIIKKKKKISGKADKVNSNIDFTDKPVVRCNISVLAKKNCRKGVSYTQLPRTQTLARGSKWSKNPFLIFIIICRIPE